MCAWTVFPCVHLHSPDSFACGDGWEGDSEPPAKGAVALPEHALGVLVSS